MKVSVAQLISTENKEENLAKACEYIKKAKDVGSDLVVFPEHHMITISNPSKTNRADVAETTDGPFVTKLAEAAKRHNIYVACGIYEKKPGEESRAYNSVVFINRTGEVVYNYRKTHLYDAFGAKESDGSVPGSEPPQVIDTEFGKVGIMICYDVRFPEVARQLTLQGAEIILAPTAWKSGTLKEHHWHTLVKARAIENTVFMVGADQIGNDNVGNSMIVDPMGVAISSAGEEEALISAELDIKRLYRVREKLPSLNNRKPELYT